MPAVAVGMDRVQEQYTTPCFSQALALQQHVCPLASASNYSITAHPPYSQGLPRAVLRVDDGPASAIIIISLRLD